MLALLYPKCYFLIMKPEDVEGLRELRFKTALAARAAEDFEREKSLNPEASETLTPSERFEQVWSHLRNFVNPRMTNDPETYAPTFWRIVITGTDEKYSRYGLHFTLYNELEGRRAIEAIWEHHRTVEGGATQESFYVYRESFNEEHLEYVEHLEGLANIETSVAAYTSAVTQGHYTQ